MNQIITIARRDLFTTFTDRNLIIIMIATPILLSTIIGLAFGGGGTQAINMAIVNLDEGAVRQGNEIKLGDQFVTIFQSMGEGDTADNSTVPANPCPISNEDNASTNSPQDIFTLNMNVTLLDDADEARQMVDTGQQAAVLIIPANFSEMMSPQMGLNIAGILSDNREPTSQAELELYANSGQQITGSIIKSILDGIASRTIVGNIVVQSTIETLIASPDRLMDLQNADDDAFASFACVFDGSLASIQLDQQALDSVQDSSLFVQIVVSIGSAQAVFFALFTAVQSVLSIYEEKKQGTFDRLMVAPIPRWYVLAGKLLGTFVMVVFQLVVLMIGLIAVASIVEGELTLIWGTNILHLILVILSLSLSVSGIGILVAGLAKDAQQAQIFSPIVNILLAFIGGAFGIQLPRSLSQFSLIYWGSDAFDKLSIGNTDIWLNILILTVLGTVTFVLGTWLFSRRIEI